MRTTLAEEICNDTALSPTQKKTRIRLSLTGSPYNAGYDEQGRVFSSYSNNNHVRVLLVNEGEGCGWTMLMVVACTSSVEVARWLVVEQGADVNLGNEFGFTPLHAAAKNNQLEMIKALLDLGACINQVTTRFSGSSSDGGLSAGQSALHIAIRYGHTSVVDYLLMQGASLISTLPDLGIVYHAEEYAKQIKGDIERNELSRFGASMHRDNSKIPTLAAMNQIIQLVSANSLSQAFIMFNLRLLNGNISTHGSLTRIRKFTVLLKVYHKALNNLSDEKLPSGPYGIILSMLFDTKSNPNIDKNTVINYLYKHRKIQPEPLPEIKPTSTGNKDKEILTQFMQNYKPICGTWSICAPPASLAQLVDHVNRTLQNRQRSLKFFYTTGQRSCDALKAITNNRVKFSSEVLVEDIRSNFNTNDNIESQARLSVE